jgi:hypothetical protein
VTSKGSPPRTVLAPPWRRRSDVFEQALQKATLNYGIAPPVLILDKPAMAVNRRLRLSASA